MLEIFMKMNTKLEETGRFKQDEQLKLYKLLASNNNVIANVISRLGILEGSDAGWEDDDADSTWQALRKDFEIMQRFKGMICYYFLCALSFFTLSLSFSLSLSLPLFLFTRLCIYSSFYLFNSSSDLSLKVDLVKDNTRFFLDMLHNKESNRLEWIIIVLIAGMISIRHSVTHTNITQSQLNN